MPSAFRNGGFIGIPKEYASIHEPIADFALIDFASGIDDRLLTVPTTAKAGDLAILIDSLNASPPVSPPFGWTSVVEGSAGNTNLSVTVAYRILTASDIGGRVFSTNNSTTDHFMQLVVVGTNNENAAFSSVSISGVLSNVTTGATSNQDIILTNVSLPAFGVVVYAQRGSNGNLIVDDTPISDAVAITLDGSNRKIMTYLKFFGIGTTPSDTAVPSFMRMDLGDAGQQGQIGFVVTPTSATGIKEYSSGIWGLDNVFEVRK